MVKYQIPRILKAWPFDKFKTGPDAQCFCHCESKQQWQALITLKNVCSVFSVASKALSDSVKLFSAC